MKLLALETTDRQGTIAVLEDGVILLETPLCPETQRSAQSLVPSIKTLFSQLGWNFDELDAIAVAVGPGSFTGLRVGVTTAKTLAYSLSIPILGINTLEALAWGIAGMSVERIVSTGIEAQRGDVAAARFYIDEKRKPLPLDASFQVIPISSWLNAGKEADGAKNSDCENNTERGNLFYSGLVYQKIQAAMSKDYIFCGPLLKRLENRISTDIQNHFASEAFWYPRASCVAELAAVRMSENDTDDPWTLVPLYSRLSAAEEKRAGILPVPKNANDDIQS